MSVPFSQPALIQAMIEAINRLGMESLNSRQINAVVAGVNIIMDALSKPHVPAEPDSGLARWLASDETGRSSLYMAYCCAPLAEIGYAVPQINSWEYDPHPYPHDPSDFGCCIGLLAAVPELRPHIQVLAEGHGKEWAALIGAWPELEALYAEEKLTGKANKLYARMQELLEGTR